MYLHIGQETVLREKDILGIFDLDAASVSKITREYLAKNEKEKNVVTVTPELPKSFIVTAEKNKKQTVYLSQISAATLKKRLGFIDEEKNMTFLNK